MTEEQIHKTVQEMLKDRGMEIVNDCDSWEIPIMFKATTFIVYYTEPKVGIKTVKNIEEVLAEEEINHVILIYQTSITPTARSYLDEIKSKYIIELFKYTELLCNITHHELVPKHEIVSHDVKNQLLKIHKISEKNLPRILHTDPVAKYLGAKCGQLIKITRPSETAGTYETYRLCC